VSKRWVDARRPRVNRRAFLRGAAGVSVALPFLESLPDRSAWAAGEAPIFSLFICAVEGVVPETFFPPMANTPLTQASLVEAKVATSELAAHAEKLLFLENINWPLNTGVAEPHAEGLCAALTGLAPQSNGSKALAAGPSADQVIASKVHPGSPALTLYAGNLHNGYIAERLSYTGAGELVAATDSPYPLYQELMGLAKPGGEMTPEGEEASRLLLESRKSIHDLVREELVTLMGSSRLSAADRQRLQQHFDAIRDAENTMGNLGNENMERCTSAGLPVDRLEAMKTFKYSNKGGVNEELVELHMSLVALAFACNYRRSATIQWGDGIDGTIYDVPSNEELGWKFSYISHRAQSDGTVGDNPLAAQAHAEIDVVRMRAFAAGLEHFSARDLADHSFVLWTNSQADGPGHRMKNVPHIIWGSGGGALLQGQYADTGGIVNDRLLKTLVNVAIRDTGEKVDEFGGDTGGELAALLV
jgi:hypothetical protein